MWHPGLFVEGFRGNIFLRKEPRPLPGTPIVPGDIPGRLSKAGFRHDPGITSDQFFECFRGQVVRMRLSPMAVVLQRSWRMHLSRKAVLSRRRVKALAASERHNKAAARITMALRKVREGAARAKE
jgi:hypothetical protein